MFETIQFGVNYEQQYLKLFECVLTHELQFV